MADTKISALTENTAPITTDLVAIVDDPGGTPATQRTTLANLSKGLNASNIATGTLKHEQGGLEADVSAYDGLVKISAGSTSAVTAPTGDIVGISDAQTLTNKDISNANNTYRAASDTATGAVELATIAETNTGTDTGRAITPDGLAGSNHAIRYLQAVCFDFTTAVATGDGKGYFHIPPAFNGMNLIYVHGEVITAGTTGTTDIQIHNVTDAADMLSTKLTIDTGETGSDTAATAAVIDGTADDVATNDLLRIDVDAVSTTAPQGLLVTLGFQLA